MDPTPDTILRNKKSCKVSKRRPTTSYGKIVKKGIVVLVENENSNPTIIESQIECMQTMEVTPEK